MGLEEVIVALRNAVKTIRGIADSDLEEKGTVASDLDPNASSRTKSLLTFIVTNGTTLVAHQGGKQLLYSTWKTRCGDRDTCPSLSASCEVPVASGGKINHLVIASERLQGENVWDEMEEGDVVGVDWRMRLVLDRVGGMENGMKAKRQNGLEALVPASHGCGDTRDGGKFSW
jgi:hypothetical protein